MYPAGSLVDEKIACLFVCFSQVSIEEGDAKAKEFGVMFIETSSKAGFNIKVNLFPAWTVYLYRFYIPRR